MRCWAVAAVAALFLYGPSFAADMTGEHNASWIEPKYEALKAQWPRDAQGQLVYGEVKLDCGVGSNGSATDCKVQTSSDPRLDEAALKLTSLYKARAPKTSRGIVDVDVRYDERADWLKKPTSEDMLLVWPRKAATKGISGMAMIKCVVNTQGLLQTCSVKSESPRGYGFGQAAQLLAPIMLMKPATRDGKPVDSEIDLPIAFSTENGANLILPNTLVVGTLAWSKTPSTAEIVSQMDKKVGDKFANGKIVFICTLNKVTGQVSECALANASPGMAQFRSVANAIVPQFQADAKSLATIRTRLDPTETEAKVILPFSFPDMASSVWEKRHLTQVEWTRLLRPSPGQPLFPAEALKAGITNGSASIDCLIGDTGNLSDCTVVSESASGVGFGAMAKTIAEGSAVNLWTDEGLPASGARVQLPIKMAYDEKLAAPAPTATTPAASPGSSPPSR